MKEVLKIRYFGIVLYQSCEGCRNGKLYWVNSVGIPFLNLYMLLLSDYKQASHRMTCFLSSKEPHKLLAYGSISALQVFLRGQHIIYKHYQIKYAFPNAGNKIYSIDKVPFHHFLQLHSDVTNILCSWISSSSNPAAPFMICVVWTLLYRVVIRFKLGDICKTISPLPDSKYSKRVDFHLSFSPQSY